MIQPRQPDSRLIVALDAPDPLTGLQQATRLGEAAVLFRIGLGMLTCGGLALANELMGEHDKRIFLDLKLFDGPEAVTAAVRGLAGFGPDLLTVHGDPNVVAAALEGARGTGLRILAVTVLADLDRADLDACLLREGSVATLAVERARRALQAGAHGVLAAPRDIAAIRALPEAEGRLIVAEDDGSDPLFPISEGADHALVGGAVWNTPDPQAALVALTGRLQALPRRG